MVTLSDRPQYVAESPRRIAAVFESNPELYDHRAQFPWVLACLGDPFAPVWFVAENPSLTQVERALDSTPEDQWNVSIGDKLFRDKYGYRWERIAVRLFGDPRRTREAKGLYDEAKGREGAARESYTGRGRRFPTMEA